MPRRPRIHVDGIPLHVVQRGHNREACFFSEGDYLCYLHWLRKALAETGCRLHAYALMTNHVHLLLTPSSEGSISRLLMSLGRRYVQYVNRFYERTGTLWDSRYKASLVQSDAYFLACLRYIDMNPVRAGMVKDPADYRWSSYRCNALGVADSVIEPHRSYLDLGGDESRRRASYHALCREQLDQASLDAIRLALNQGQPLGDDRFRGQIEQVTGYRCRPRPRGLPVAEATEKQIEPDPFI